MPSIRELVAQGAARLAAVSIAEPRREATRLWAGLAGSTPGSVTLRAGEAADPVLQAAFERGAATTLAVPPGFVGRLGVSQ
jgi:hypothetical protein